MDTCKAAGLSSDAVGELAKKINDAHHNDKKAETHYLMEKMKSADHAFCGDFQLQVQNKLDAAPVSTVEETKDFLFKLVEPLAKTYNSQVSMYYTLNWRMFFGSAVRYFFTVYKNGLAYRICTIDNKPTRDAPCEGYISFISHGLGTVDEYTQLNGDYEERGSVEILVYRKPDEKSK
jgi:hypothetical protein